MLERQTNYELKLQLEDLMNKDERNQDDLASLQHHIQDQEQIIRDLEDRAIYYQDQLHLLNMGIKIAAWWNTWSWLIINDEETPGMIDEAIANIDTTINKQDVKDMLEDQFNNVTAIKTDFEQREQGLAHHIESLQHDYELFLKSLGDLVWGANNDNNEAGADYKDELIKRVQCLLHNELALKKQVDDLEKKESAYTKTIQEADSIMARVEISYQERIKELEQEKHDLREKIRSLEHSISKQKSDQKDEMKTISELIEKLDQVEQSEALMKEKITALEKYSEEMKNKVSETELANTKIKHELRDQDELIKRINDMDAENKKITQEIDRLKDIEQKLAELRKTEELLRTRVEELELVSEQSAHSEKSSGDKEPGNYQEQKMTDGGCCQEAGRQLQQESGDVRMMSVRTTSVVLQSSNSSHLPDNEEQLKRQVNTLKLQIRDLEHEVESKSQELESIEGGYRSEVSLNSQLGSGAATGGNFHRYRSMRDHTGRFFLCVKIR